MKVIFENVAWKNFLSYGNNVTELPLNKEKTTLIVGKNGSGKSTVSDVICFCLFGKAFRNINKGDLINSINGKDLWTCVTFSKGSTQYKVVRGQKPNVFEIWKNDVLIPQTADSEYQTVLEEALGFNLKTFKQIALIGKASYVPFMQQTAANRRDMVEDLLDIKVFSHMNVITKEKISKTKAEIQTLSTKLEYIRGSIAAIQSSTQEFKNEILKDIERKKEKIQTITNWNEEILENIAQIKAEIAEASEGLEKKTKYETNLRKLTDMEKELETHISIIKKEISFFEKNKNCPSCKQDIEHTHKNSIVEEKTAQIKEHDDTLIKIEEHFIANQKKLKEINEHEKLIDTKKQSLNTAMEGLKRNKYDIKTNETEITYLEKKLEKKDVNVLELEKSLAETEVEMGEIVAHKENLEIVGDLLKDGGIKTQIIKKHIPIMNKLINKYLAAMDFFVNFEIDEEFNEIIKSRYRDKFKYSSFSEGEKLRIDLSILFCWRAIAKTRNSVNSNILFLDEIFESSLDDAGTEEFLKILNDLTDGTNVFIISHKSDQLFDKFEKVYKFEKYQSFSRLS